MNIFLNKKVLVYGLGKSGLSSFKFLKKKSKVFLYDDNQLIIRKIKDKRNLITYKKILNTKFDQIIISPGIDLTRCRLSKFLRKNSKIIYSDLDVFYAAFKHLIFIIFMQKRFLTDYQVCLLAGILISVWPFSPNGNFFHNWLMIVYSLPVGLYLQSIYSKK